MESYSKTMLKGLIVILPLLITAYVIYWIASTMELLVGGLLKFLFLGSIYLPGMGVFAGFVLLFLAGLLMERSGITQKVYGFVDGQLERIPLVKSLYGGLKDMLQFFSSDEGGKKVQKVVLVTFGEHFQAIGFVTGKTLAHIINDPAGEQAVAVYLPMSFQLGGFTVYVPRSVVRPLDMSVEDAMVAVVTGGVGKTE
jgi:uncharacterized membrane protein